MTTLRIMTLSITPLRKTTISMIALNKKHTIKQHSTLKIMPHGTQHCDIITLSIMPHKSITLG
jgi:hypothetical protein